jgi:hypothetical protein
MRAGYSIALSANGSTVVFGVPGDNSNQGCGIVFAFNGSDYTVLGGKLIASGLAILGLLFRAVGKEQ